jgi:Saxitoxin biosynthesis operon protein SxtJ
MPMNLIRIEYHPTRAQLAVFGLIWTVFFGVLGAVILGRGGSLGVATGVWAAAIVVPAIGWIEPRFMRMVYLGMALLTLPIGFVLSYVILGAVYYLVLTPTGLLMRAMKYDPMKRRFDDDAESYWIARKPKSDLKSYFRQF